MIESCSAASQVANDVVSLSASVVLNPAQVLSTVNFRITLNGGTPVVYTLDDVSAVLTLSGGSTPVPSSTPSATPTPTPTPTASPSPTPVALTAAWANEGGDKVTQDETRASSGGASSVINSVWNGSQITLSGAGNETVSFNLILEALKSTASNVSVSLQSLTGPNGAQISSVPATGNGVFNWIDRNIELFYVRYLQINGLSLISYETYDERHIPQKLERPWTGAGNGAGVWTDRPNHNKYYPDIAVPIELVPTFNVAATQNQSVWGDIYIPSGTPAGVYSGTITVKEGTNVSYSIPIQLTVRPFQLPDTPSSKTMAYLGDSEISERFTGIAYPNGGTPQDNLRLQVRNTYYQLAHRHKISLIDSDTGNTAWSNDAPRPEWQSRLDGTLFTSANGYAGPGVGVSNGVYSIGTYGSWTWQSQGQSGMQTHTNNWEQWFETNFPNVTHFLYLIDESTDFTQTEQWANWMKTNPGIGKNLKSFATLNLTDAVASVPDLSIATSWFEVGITSAWQSAYNTFKSTPGNLYFDYNGKRPSQGSFATDDDGVALRELPWAQFKKGVDRWMFWESSYYNDYQGGRGETDVFNTAATFSGTISQDPVLGETGWNHSNGDGLLFYPGTDMIYPKSSYGVNGPFASLRLKHWRRGIQDVDYINLAYAINPTATMAIVNAMVPEALWEYGVTDPTDPTWVRTNISWSINPDDWESARAQLAAIIQGTSN
jgi:hypothetical protein